MALEEFSIPSCIVKAIKDAGYEPDTSMQSYIDRWWKWYTGSDGFYKVKYSNHNGNTGTRDRMTTRPAKRASAEWASLLLNEDTTISVDTDGANKWLQGQLDRNNFWPTGQMIIEKAFAIGTAAWALWFDVKDDSTTDIKIRRYDARMVVPLSWDEGGITECAFVTRVSVKGKRADQLQMHVFDGSTYRIITKIFINDKELTEYQYSDYRILTDFNTQCESKTFGIIKPGIENTKVDLSPYGMSIFEDAISSMMAVDMTFDAMFQEIELTEITIFMSDELLDVVDYKGKKMPLPKGSQNRIFRKLFGGQTKDIFEVVSPDIRIDPLQKAFNVALAQFGDQTGFGEQYFKLDKNGGLKTATEVTSDNSALMRNIKKHENVIRGGIQDIITAYLTCARIHMGAPIEEDFGSVKVEFDDSIIIDTQAEKMTMISEINAGLLPAWKYAETFYGMTETEAKAALPQRVYEEGM